MDSVKLTKGQKRAIDRVGRYLARRDHSIYELQTKLSQHFDEDEVEFAIQFAEDSGWLRPPEDLAERLKESLNERNKSARYIQDKLRRKGLPSVDTEESVEIAKCKAVLMSLATKNDILEHNSKAKVFRKLASRGFTPDIIFKSFDEIKEQIKEDADETD